MLRFVQASTLCIGSAPLPVRVIHVQRLQSIQPSRALRARPAYAGILACCCLLAACASASARAWNGGDYPGVLRAPETLPQDGVWRQRVTASWGEDEQNGFDAVLQKSGDTLTVLGLSPMGSMGFAIVLSGNEIDVTNHTQREMSIPPHFILLDVQRCFYPWLPVSAAFGIDGRYEGEVDGEHVVEVLEAGKLKERTFTRLDGAPPGEIRVTYRWTRDDWHVPGEVVLDNGWFGYRLRVETHEETLLEPTQPVQ